MKAKIIKLEETTSTNTYLKTISLLRRMRWWWLWLTIRLPGVDRGRIPGKVNVGKLAFQYLGATYLGACGEPVSLVDGWGYSLEGCA